MIGIPIILGSGAASKVKVDSSADSDYLGASGSTGNLRTDSTLSYTDGGDYLTLGLDHLGIEDLSDAGADKILFWDDGESACKWLAVATGLAISTTNLSLSHLGIESLSDAGADKILFWDDSETATKWLATSTGLTISGTNLSLSHLGIESLSDPDADRILFWDDSETATKWLTVSTGLTVSTTNLSLSHLGIESLTDPDDDKMMAWDDTDGTMKFITFGSNLTYDHATYTLNASGAGSASHFRATDASTQTIGSGSWTTLALDTEDYDVGSDYNTGTYTYTAPTNGYYHISGHVGIQSLNVDDLIYCRAYKNGTTAIMQDQDNISANTTSGETGISGTVYLAATDTVVLQAYHNYGSDRTTFNESHITWFSVHQVATA